MQLCMDLLIGQRRLFGHGKGLSVMRLSVNEDDDGYANWTHLQRVGKDAEIFLDGVQQNYVLTVDDELGMIVRQKVDADGRVVAEGDEIIAETVTGAVEIRIREKSDGHRH